MKTNYNILYKAIREVFIKKWKFSWHLMAANEKLNFTSFPEISCFLSKITLFSDQKVPLNLRKLRYFQVDYYPSLNAPILKKTYLLNVYVCCTVCFLSGMPLKSVRLNSKSHRKSSKCPSFPRVWRSHF